MTVTTATREDRRDTDAPSSAVAVRLAQIWGTPRGLIGALSTVDHKIIARRYIITAFFFLLLAGASAIVMRLQLAAPENRVVGPDLYNQLFTMHGTTMMFLFAVPVMEAFAVYSGRRGQPSDECRLGQWPRGYGPAQSLIF